MIVVNTDYVAGHKVVRTLGLVQGSTVRSKHAGHDFLAGWKAFFGGEIRSYTDLIEESRQQAIGRMMEMAQKMGANAILNVRFSNSSIMQGSNELFCWGTAVVIE